MFSACPMLEQKNHFKQKNSILCPPPHLAHFGLRLKSLGMQRQYVLLTYTLDIK